MLATSGPVPVGPGWAFEVKFDGVRAIGYAGRGGLRLYSRNDRDISGSYPEVAALQLGRGVVVDGELVALDGHGRPDFGLLQHRMHITTPTAELLERVPVQYVVFDLLHRKDRSLLEQPYSRRRELLDRLDLERPGLRVPANFTDIGGDVVLAAIAQQGLEGVVAKRLVSPYQPGRRSRAWIKTPIRHTAEIVIAGWAPSTGNADAWWSCCSRCAATNDRLPVCSCGRGAGWDVHPAAVRCTGWRHGWSARSSTGRSPAKAASGTRRGGAFGTTAIPARSTHPSRPSHGPSVP
jgi:ATP-dependent DNA ligase